MRNNRKGFTIVELVIVIAVIAILAAVLIPTFGGMVKKANDSAALQEATNAYKAYSGDVDYAEGEELAANLIIKVDDKYVVVKSGSVQDKVYDKLADAKTAAGIDNEDIYETDNKEIKDMIYVECANHADGDDADSNCDNCGVAINN